MTDYFQAKKFSLRPIYYLLLILIGLGFSSCGSQKKIVNGLDEREANEIIVFLSSRGINAIKTQSTESTGSGANKVFLWDIEVPPEDAMQAMAILNQNGLPRRRGQNLLGIFANSGLVPSEMQDTIRYQAGLGEQIANVIRKIDGVLDAEVQISFPKEDPLNPAATKGKITASVYVKHSGVLDDPNAHLITKIKRLVAASVPGLDFDNVTVIGDRARFNEPHTSDMQTVEQEKHLANVWSIAVSQDSVTRFQVIFFTFIILLLIMFLSLAWICWKLFPLLKQHGGIKELMNLHAISLEKKEAKEEKGVEKEGEKPPENKDQGLVNKDIDET